MASDPMQSPTRELAWLRVLLLNLPTDLHAPKKGEFTRYPFATFRIDQAILERTENEVGAINESFKAIFGWRTCTTGDGILDIEERGKHGISAVADLLEGYLKKYRDKKGSPNAVLVKWVEDISAGCVKIYHTHNKRLPDLPVEKLHNFANEKSASSSLGAQLETAATTEDSITPSHAPSVLSTPLSSSAKPKPSTGKQPKLLLDFTNAGREQLQLKIDFCIMKLICVCGLVPNLLDTDEWKEFMVVSNPRYKWTPSDTFERKYIPQEAWRVHNKVKEILKQERNLTLTFDGNSTRKPQSVYTTHITTKDRTSYFYGGYEGSDEHHTAEWVRDIILEGIRDIGEDNFSGLCSDSTGNTKKGKSLAKDILVAILTLPDCCHHLHNTIKEISNLPEFQKLEQRRLEEDVTQGLIKIGKTRFATHYSACISLERCFPFIRDLIVDQVIKIKNKEVMTAFTGQRANLEFQLALKQYSTIIGPLARSLWALEAAQTNAADVYMFWLAIAAELRDLFSCPEDTGIEPELAKKIIHIFLRRHKEFIDESPDDIYFIAAYLDPRYVNSDILNKPILVMSGPTITIPGNNFGSDSEADMAPCPRAYKCVKKGLKVMLRNEIEAYKCRPSSAGIGQLVKQAKSAKAIAEEFSPQLLAYSRGEYPFSDPVGLQTVLEWWESLASHPKARTLAFFAIKIFSVLVNSMPDERTGSKITWFNSPLRSNQKVSTLVNMIQVGQWYGVHQKEGKSKLPPNIKFRNMDNDLNRKRTTPAACGTSLSGEALQTVRLVDVIESEDEDDGSVTDTDNIGNTSGVLELDPDINLNAPCLRNVLPTSASEASAAVVFAALVESPTAPRPASNADGAKKDVNEIDWDMI
ncbi:ribonuclease H-like domain-containing protein [Armillaria novae-zelandiae]|uniref:Ribonuclease H-like domain-containing protein n=1 Tax=Armillaria novae-zelandiae TaxID=153914 RepID=A0AA39U4E7_9AGAR|nr:ribonuclease H-like domain-containing protein [Armillaria novae-zelandiae]